MLKSNVLLKPLEVNFLSATTNSVDEKLQKNIIQYGFLHPIIVHEIAPKQYSVLDGNQRLNIAKVLNLPSILCVIISDKSFFDIAQQKLFTNPIAQAKIYNQLMKEGKTQVQIAKMFGVSRVQITNTLRLLQLHTYAQYFLEIGKLSASHGCALLQSKNLTEDFIYEIVNSQLSVHELRTLLHDHNKQTDQGNLTKQDGYLLAKQLESKLKVPVQIDVNKKQIVFNYNTLENLDLILRLLK